MRGTALGTPPLRLDPGALAAAAVFPLRDNMQLLPPSAERLVGWTLSCTVLLLACRLSLLLLMEARCRSNAVPTGLRLARILLLLLLPLAGVLLFTMGVARPRTSSTCTAYHSAFRRIVQP